MKALIIHGENTAISRNTYYKYIDDYKSKNYEIRHLGDEVSQNLANQSLFDDKIVYVSDTLKKFKPKDLEWISKNYKKNSSELLLFSDGDLPVKILKSFPKDVKIEKYDLPKIIFNFLDSFYPGNARNTLVLLSKVLTNLPIEIVFAMLGKHVRDLYWVTDSRNSPNYQDWRLGKLKKQANSFTREKLKKIINLMTEADIKSKTTDNSLKNFLDLIILTQLK